MSCNVCFSLLAANFMCIYQGISYGPEENLSFRTLRCQQLPRPQTIRRLWHISVKFSGGDIMKVAPSHAAQVAVMAFEKAFSLSEECIRRGCEKTVIARCVCCRSGVTDNILSVTLILYIIHILVRRLIHIPQDILLPVYMYLLYILDGTVTAWMKSSVFIHLTQLPSNPIIFGFGRLALRCDFSKTKIQPFTSGYCK